MSSSSDSSPPGAPRQRQDTSPSAVDLLGGLVLDDGRRWGHAALPWQRADALAVLDPTGPRRHYLLRARGMSKTTDAAAVALALLLTEAPPRSRSYCYAVDADQAGLFADALAGYVARTPGLAGAVDVGARAVTVRATGATLSVESSDGASAYGVRPWLTVADELGMWPTGANHRRLWAAVTSALPKVPGSRLLVTTTAGSPTGIGAEVWAEAERSAQWRAVRRPGPSPWWTDDDTEATRASLTRAEWRRLIACEWAEGDDSLTTAGDVTACVRAGSTALPHRPGVSYVAALDVGTRRDLTALAVAHTERRNGGPVVVVDRVIYWRPERQSGGRVDLAEVESATRRACREYRTTRLRFDRMQAEQLAQNLDRAGVRCDEYVFSSAGANRLARTLANALRDRTVELPDDTEVIAELTTARMVETGPGTVKMVNPPGTHDDVAVAVGMCLVDLQDRPVGGGSVSVPRGRLDRRDNRSSREALRSVGAGRASAAMVQGARRRGPRGVLFVAGVPGAYDDPRRRGGRQPWQRR